MRFILLIMIATRNLPIICTCGTVRLVLHGAVANF